jgi:hypothetical protein
MALTGPLAMPGSFVGAAPPGRSGLSRSRGVVIGLRSGLALLYTGENPA